MPSSRCWPGGSENQQEFKWGHQSGGVCRDVEPNEVKPVRYASSLPNLKYTISKAEVNKATCHLHQTMAPILSTPFTPPPSTAPTTQRHVLGKLTSVLTVSSVFP